METKLAVRLDDSIDIVAVSELLYTKYRPAGTISVPIYFCD